MVSDSFQLLPNAWRVVRRAADENSPNTSTKRKRVNQQTVIPAWVGTQKTLTDSRCVRVSYFLPPEPEFFISAASGNTFAAGRYRHRENPALMDDEKHAAECSSWRPLGSRSGSVDEESTAPTVKGVYETERDLFVVNAGK